MSEAEQFYDDVIAPKLAEIGKLCQERKMPFLAFCQYGPTDVGQTRFLPPETFAPLKDAERVYRYSMNAEGGSPMSIIVGRVLAQDGAGSTGQPQQDRE